MTGSTKLWFEVAYSLPWTRLGTLQILVAGQPCRARYPQLPTAPGDQQAVGRPTRSYYLKSPRIGGFHCDVDAQISGKLVVLLECPQCFPREGGHVRIA